MSIALVQSVSATDEPYDVDKVSDVYVWDRPGAPLEEALDAAWVNDGYPAVKYVATSTVLREWVGGLLAYIQKNHPSGTDFNVQMPQPDDTMHVFRGYRESTVDGTLLSLRRLAGMVPSVDDLIFPPWWRPLMMQESFCNEGGLLILCAPNGNGKSTTLAAIIRSRLEAFGGHCRTVENPVELPLNGPWGKGVCVQKEVDTTQDEQAFARALRRTMARGFPAAKGNIMMVGEVRDADTAAQVVKGSVTGVLVLATVHGDSPIGAVQRLCAYAGAEMGHEVARDMVASSLRLAAYQSMVPNPNPKATAWKSKVIQGSMLISQGLDSPIAGPIRAGKFEGLNNMLDRQATIMRTDPVPTPQNRERALADFLARASTM